jgi:hypothetical protein
VRFVSEVSRLRRANLWNSSVHPNFYFFFLVNSVTETLCCYAREGHVRNEVTLGMQRTFGAMGRLVLMFVFLMPSPLVFCLEVIWVMSGFLSVQ